MSIVGPERSSIYLGTGFRSLDEKGHVVWIGCAILESFVAMIDDELVRTR